MNIFFNEFSEILAGISNRFDGSMVWWNRKPIDQTVKLNRDNYFSKIGVDPKRVVAGGIVHGNNVGVVNGNDAGEYLLDTDALITNVPDLFLTVTVADCVPVYYYDFVNCCVGIAHAGWRGLVGGILENVVEKMKDNIGSNAEDISVVIGPHIKPCHYEVGKEVAEKFDDKNIESRDGHLFVDLGNEAKLRLENVGVRKISISPECTYCLPEKFYSARRDKVDPLQGMVAYIGIKK